MMGAQLDPLACVWHILPNLFVVSFHLRPSWHDPHCSIFVEHGFIWEFDLAARRRIRFCWSLSGSHFEYQSLHLSRVE